ncbi:MAG: aldo/keto reductase [Acetanaerobacterium sp.]
MKKLLIESKTQRIVLPKIILGCSFFGTGVDENTSLSIMDAYADLGGTCFDTASVYGDWDDEGEPISELLIGRWLKQSGYRDKMKIISKGAHHRMKTPHISRVSASCIADDIEKSLRSLEVDAIDLYFLHRDNVNVPVSEIMPVLHKYVAAGRLKAIGASNWSIKRILEANLYALNNNLTPFTVSQIQWSLARLTPEYNEFEDLPHMTETEYEQYLAAAMPVIAWSSQAGGIITRVIKNSLESINESARNKYCNDTTMHRIENVKAVCKQTGISPTQAALGYITCNPLPAAAIIGVSSVEHLRDSMTVADLDLSTDIVEQLIH